jgi:hypothetical protein
MSRRWDTFALLPLASRSAAGVSTGFCCGEYDDGQLHLYAPTLAAGAWVRGFWQSSADGLHWGDYLATATLGATGVTLIAAANIGQYTRVRWTQSGTTVNVSATFVLKE